MELVPPKDHRFVHPQEGTIDPVVSEIYYYLGVALHRLRLLNTPSTGIGTYLKIKAAEEHARVMDGLLHHAHIASYQEHPTTRVALTRYVPNWAQADSNAALATHDGIYVLYRDATRDNPDGPWQPSWEVTRWNGETDTTIATVKTTTAARAVIAAHQAPQADAHVQSYQEQQHAWR